mmetsp:Transcript_21557/g.34677  ORF Transcript_21557/g.34677 Transcript_21557/m.34677 type:complete len:574 (-) Transcript_21557:1023-2744(-)
MVNRMGAKESARLSGSLRILLRRFYYVFAFSVLFIDPPFARQRQPPSRQAYGFVPTALPLRTSCLVSKTKKRKERQQIARETCHDHFLARLSLRRRNGNDDDDDDFENSNDHKTRQTVFTKALAIVPQTEDWDRLQRARHYARDPLFHEWPPAIRIFHPFSSSPNAPFDVAQVVEDLELEPFEVTFDTWVIIPHVEAMQMLWQNQRANPEVEYKDMGIGSTFGNEAYEEIRQLIAVEEEKAANKAQKNKKKGTNSKKQKACKEQELSPLSLRDEQKKAIDEDFGGPCILCLEPDEDSKQKLIELRETLQEGLDHDSYSSPSSVYSWEFVRDVDMGYRPLIPISSFESFQSAMDVARRIKGLWGDPLTLAVKELHVMSCKEDDEPSRLASPGVDRSRPSSIEWKNQAWGCNAKIMLYGEEIEQDESANKDMVDKLMEMGEQGGGDITQDYTILDDEEESTSDIEKWLDDDDDFDEGTQLIIGRTHFFTGDQRTYKGMPATSVVDAKDRSLGDVGAVSGSARRRGSASRQGSLWEDGEYGRRQKDYSPWGMRERGAKEKFANLPKEAKDQSQDQF